MAAQGILLLAKCYPSTLISVFLTGFCYFSYQVATQLASRGWVDPIPDPILPEKFLGYSRELNPGPLGWQSDMLTTIPNRWSTSFLDWENHENNNQVDQHQGSNQVAPECDSIGIFTFRK